MGRGMQAYQSVSAAVRKNTFFKGVVFYGKSKTNS
jgi:hypothetical protein